jgi:hypothetical protein
MTYSYAQYPAQQQAAQYYSPTPHLVAPPRAVASESVEKLVSGAAVKNGSVKIAPGPSPKVYTMTFVVDATVDSVCTISIGVKEVVKGGITLQPLTGTPIELPRFNVATGTSIQQTVTLDVTNIPPNVLKYDAAQPKHIPIVICLSYGDQAHYTYIRLEGGTASTIKEVLQAHGSAYELQHVYGAEVVSDSQHNSPVGRSADAAGHGGDSGEEGQMCVVCLSEPKDTTVLPCRHMCMCKDCAEIIKRQNPQQCPICRTPIEQLLVCRK